MHNHQFTARRCIKMSTQCYRSRLCVLSKASPGNAAGVCWHRRGQVRTGAEDAQSNVNPGFDLQLALSQLKVKSHSGKVIKVLGHFSMSSLYSLRWQSQRRTFNVRSNTPLHPNQGYKDDALFGCGIPGRHENKRVRSTDRHVWDAFVKLAGLQQ